MAILCFFRAITMVGIACFTGLGQYSVLWTADAGRFLGLLTAFC